jgi:phage terminase small subunit
MPEYAPEGAGKAFAQSRACFAGMEEWLSGAVAAGLTHAELEEQVDARGRELLRRMYQDHLDLRAACEQRLQKVTGADGVARIRAETGHTRPLATVFGQVTVTRIAYRARLAGAER